MTGPEPVRAAGAVLWRRGAGGGLEVAIVHRPEYDDWSLPKGKVKGSETALAAAVREVAEETGVRARPGARAGETRYRQRRGGVEVDKVVEYWVMEAVDGRFTPGDEVDELRWLPPDEAARLLTYPHDRALLATADLPR